MFFFIIFPFLLGFYPVCLDLNDTVNVGEKLMAVGDIDNDKHLDLITVSSEQD